MLIGMVAGEHSGDSLGAALIHALQKKHPHVVVEGVAGPKMLAAGCFAVFPMERLNVMGFRDPFFRLPELWWRRRALLQRWRQRPPQVVVTIDAPDFNLGLAQHLKKAGVKVVHYVSPTVWAWRSSRIYSVAKAVDHLLTLFPFEPAYYHCVPSLKVSYVGHPLAEEIVPLEKAKACQQLGLSPVVRRLAILPGSRTREIKMHLPIFLEAAALLKAQISGLECCVAAVNAEKAELIDTHHPVFVTKTAEVIAASDAVLLVSGTASLETLLYARPMVVAYKTDPCTYWLAKQLIKTAYIALPNIIEGAALVPECIQQACTPKQLAHALLPLLQEDQQALKTRFLKIREILQKNSANRAAEIVLSTM